MAFWGGHAAGQATSRTGRWVLGLALAALCALAWAGPARSLRFERIGVDQGLSQDSVLNVLQDRSGFMWFGTQAGLNRFDGYKATVYRNDPDDPASLPDNFVLTSHEDAQGRLWFGTKGGLARFDEATHKFVRYLPGTPGSASSGNRGISAIASDGRGGLWLGTGSGLHHFDPDTGAFRALRHDPADRASLVDDRVTALALDGHGGLWVGTAAGLDRLDASGRFEHYRMDPAGDGRRNTIVSLSMGPRDTLWIGTAAGLDAWRLGEGAPRRTRFGAADGMSGGRITTLYHDAGGVLWVGTELDGLKWRDPSSGKFVSYNNQPLDRHSLSDNQIGSVCVDRTGTLWVGTLFGGVNRVDLASGGFTRYTHTPGHRSGIGNNKVRAIIGDGDGRLWIGTTGGGLTHLDPDTGKAETIRHVPGRGDSLPDDIVTSLALAHGKLWIGSAGGLAWRDPSSGRFKTVVLGEDPNSNYIQALRQSRDGTLWVVTRGGLFGLGADGSRRAWRHDPRNPASLGENLGYAVLEDREGMLWIGTDNGLDRFDRRSGTFTHYRHDPASLDGLRHSRVYALFESAQGELWVGTAGGLHRMRRGAGGEPRFVLAQISNGRETLPIGAVLEDAGGMLWVSSTVGIIRLDPRSGKFKRYTAEDGLIDGSYFVGSSYAAPDGELYFGGVHGMTAFMPSAIRDNPYPPTVVITDFSVLNRPRSLEMPVYHAREIEVSWRDTAFSLEFAALHYADPRANRYSYRLDGFDQGWIETDARKRFATYTNLDPGRYTFRVRAANKDGVWSSAPAALVITITPPFWKTPWFRVLAATLVLGSAWLGYRMRVRALVQQKDRLERQVGARTAELVLQKEAAERRKLETEQQKEVVEQAHRNISRLSDMGRKLTANLDSQAVMSTLYEHVKALMAAPVFGIGLHKPDRGTIAYPFAVADGRRAVPFERPLAEPHQLARWCIEHNSEVFIADLARDWRSYLPDAPVEAVLAMAPPLPAAPREAPRSILMVPVVVGARVLGMVTVQSPDEGAYQRVHLDMLRTLAAYVGVALDNADAYRQLKDAQAQLASHEKLASLGSLVAGVAHELNTPIGNSLLMASTLQEKTEALSSQYRQAALRRSDLEGWIAASNEASSLIVRSLHSAAELVNSFRQVAVDQASAQRRRFDLAQACQEIAATMMKQVSVAGHTLELQVPAGIMMDSYPGPLGQVLINFINNALLHAFEQPGGHMVMSAVPAGPDRVRITFRDNGRGIEQVHLGRIFDPFYTTRMGRGGTGLGLNIVYNIVTGLLCGTIEVASEPGAGAAFIIELPLVVPDTAAAEPTGTHDHHHHH